MEVSASGSGPATGGERAGDAVSRIRADLDRGAPWDACDVFRDAPTAIAEDGELLYWGALAYARAGATGEAQRLLERAQVRTAPGSARLADILSLRGRLWKDLVHRAPQGPEASKFAVRARAEYLAAYALAQDPYPGVNAATLTCLLGDKAESQRLAREVLARLTAAGPLTGVWDQVVAGEAQLLLGQIAAARQHYADAWALAADDAGRVATMRRQLVLLAPVLPEAGALLPLLPVPAVIAFTGHLLDMPGRATSRFPAALVPAVAAALREQVAAMHRPIVYTSAACGADLLFIEAAQAVGAEVNVVLPFARDDFLRSSVAIGGEAWIARFDTALAKATRVIYATNGAYLGDDVLFEYVAELVEGLALLRAARLQTAPRMLGVLDGAAEGQAGGTRAAIERWQRSVGEPDVIDLAALRVGMHASDRPAAPADPIRENPAQGTSPLQPPASPKSPSPRTIKTMLFADLVGYSRVPDALASRLQEGFWRIAAREIAAMATPPLMANTWGDALAVVFGSPQDGAEFALRLLDAARTEDWGAAGFPEAPQLRVALHTDVVFRGFDPIMGRDNYFGAGVTKAARIEPVTPPGMAYASETFAATLAANGERDYELEYIGRLALAKGYGDSRIYRLGRR